MLSDLTAKHDDHGVLVYTFPPNTPLFRGSTDPKTENALSRADIKFFALDPKDAKQYAEKDGVLVGAVNEYHTKRALNLVALDQPNDAFYDMVGDDRVDILDRRGKKTGEKREVRKILRLQFGFKSVNQERYSVNKYDSAIVRYICARGYDGYALNKVVNTDFGGKFHREVGICAPVIVTRHADDFRSPVSASSESAAQSPSSRSRARKTRSPSADAVKSNLFGDDDDDDDDDDHLVKSNLFGDDDAASPPFSPPQKTRRQRTPSPPRRKTRRALFDSPSSPSPRKGGKRLSKSTRRRRKST